MNTPLAGIRVLDLSAIAAGATASMILADPGADVLKVESPTEGEDRMGPRGGPWGAYFVALNRGKRSLPLGISLTAGRDVVLRLAAGSDVFLANFRGGNAAALGFDEPAVRVRRADNRQRYLACALGERSQPVVNSVW
jgi:crotonobetainyl-CoA:carnitine CoA-transferase CaiB-like acyl-CoA transferase